MRRIALDSSSLASLSLALVLAIGAAEAAPASAGPLSSSQARYIVQAATVMAACKSVTQVGGHVRQELPIIAGVSAVLTPAQRDRLTARTGVRLFEDRSLSTAAANASSAAAVEAALNSVVFTDGTAVNVKAREYFANYSLLTGAETLQYGGISGKGVTIAVLDTGLWTGGDDTIKKRTLASIDVVNGGSKPVTADPFGHGTHVTSIAAGSFGIAPSANLVIVRAFDATGAGSYTDVIAGLNWIIANRQKYKIRVLNLSFGAPPQSNYWDDPLNQAVMAAWKAGIVVVASAGNEGPQPMTIGVPGNVPYVITTGALTDNYSPYNAKDDRLASFSSTGPTFEGFVKPELIAPGGHMVGLISYQSYLANIDPGSMKKDQALFTMSGTSQAAAVTSGVVALMLQADPTLSPDTVKCRLLASAAPATTSTGQLAYSVFQQGAGLINAIDAVNSSAVGCANQGLDIAADLTGTAHFGGSANQDADGNYYVMDMAGASWGAPVAADGCTWSRGFTWAAGYTWSRGYSWANGYTWSKGYVWGRGYTWSKGSTWSRGYTWSKELPWWDSPGKVGVASRPASIVSWIPNE